MATAIRDLVDRDTITEFYLIKSAEIKQTTTRKDYLDLTFGDMTGEISGKLWDATTADKEAFVAGSIVKIKANVQTYRDNLQLNVLQMRLANDEDGVQIGDFIRAAPLKPVDMVYTLKTVISQLENPLFRNVCDYCVSKVEEKLMHYPAAKTFHHNFYGGLAYHKVRMLQLADSIIAQRPFLWGDLLRAGIILHDIAKPEELVAEQGIASSYSDIGKLMGHISLVSTWITEAFIKLNLPMDSKEYVALQHMVLAHHGELEYGSPVKPQLPEAVAIHYIDQLDAKLQACEDSIDCAKAGTTWTAKVPAIDYKELHIIRR